MNERTTPNITIYRKVYSGGLAYDEAQVTVPITPACRRVCKLMSEDSITLSFSLSADDIYQPCIGDRAHDEVFGDFYLAQEALAVYNKATSGYDYNLTFVKDYWAWNNRLLMFVATRRNVPDENGIIDPQARVRTESSWVNTDTLQGHCTMIAANILEAYGTVVTFDITAKYKDEVRFIPYDNVRICDALTAIANEYECEWWVTENGNARVIHFGKCEAQSGQPYDFYLGINVESMSVSRDQNTYANKLAVFGSTKNLPSSYNRSLTFKVTETDVHNPDVPPGDDDPGYIDDEGIPVLPQPMGDSTWMFRDADKGVTLSMVHEGKAYITYGSPLPGTKSGEVVYVQVYNNEPWLCFATGANPNDLAVGDEFTLNFYDPTETDTTSANYKGGLIVTKIPDAWWLDDLDNPSSLQSIGDRRLRLPNEEIWVTPTDNEPKGNAIVEDVAIFDNVFPRNFLRVRSVTERGMTPDGEVLPDGSQKSWQWKQYAIVAENLDGSDFPFVNAYQTKDTELEMMFLSEIDEQNAYGANWSDLGNLRLLAGMTFKVGYDDADGLFTLFRNEDYGAKLPNNTLKPTVGDVLVLTGWDVKAMDSLGLVAEAEMRLKRLAQSYVDAISEGQWTFGCNMMSQWPTSIAPSGEDYGLPELGDRVTVHHDALRIWRQDMQEFIAAKTSRIIGWTAKLDYPYDTLEVTVGETEAFSRIKAMERAMSGQGKGVSTSVIDEAVVRVNIITDLSHITSNAPTTFPEGNTLVVTLTPEEGYSIDSVTVLMGNVDITATAYSNGVVTIANVTGDVSITASAVLPYDAEVEYLQNDGVAYIDTGVKPSNNTNIDVDFYLPSNADTFIFGGRHGFKNKNFALYFNNKSGSSIPIRWDYANDALTIYDIKSAGRYTAVNNANVMTAAGHVFTVKAATFSCDYSIFLFALNNAGTPKADSMSSGVRIYACKIYSSGTLVADFIPVRNNGVGYLYDKVSGQLFGNASGSGAFTYGNDK